MKPLGLASHWSPLLKELVGSVLIAESVVQHEVVDNA